MSELEKQEELVNEAPEETAEESGEQQEAPQLSAKEQQAAEMGWKPLDAWSGDPDDWVDAKTFLKNGEYMGKIHAQNRQLKEVKNALEDMKAMLNGAEKRGREAAIAELKSAKVQALQHGDYEKVADIDERIAEAKTDAKVEAKTNATTDPYEQFAQDTWYAQNPWYSKDDELKEEFNTLIIGHVTKHGAANTTPEVAFAEATKRIKRMYPEKFSTKSAPRTVAGSPTTTRPAAKKGLSWADLTAEEKKACTNFIHTGTFTKEDYIKEIQKQRESGN